jgi:hypothetical protein
MGDGFADVVSPDSEEGRVILMYRQYCAKFALLSRRFINEKRQDWLTGLYVTVVDAWINEMSTQINHMHEKATANSPQPVENRSNCYLLDRMIKAMQPIEIYILKNDRDDEDRDRFPFVLKNKTAFKILIKQLWDFGIYKLYEARSVLQDELIETYMQWFQDILKKYSDEQTSHDEDEDNVWLSIYSCQCLLDIFSDSHLSLTKANVRKELATSLYQYWHDSRGNSNSREHGSKPSTAATVGVHCQKIMRLLAKFRCLLLKESSKNQLELVQAWMKLLSSQCGVEHAIDSQDDQAERPTNLMALHQSVVWLVLGAELSLVTKEIEEPLDHNDPIPNSAHIQSKAEDLEWIQCRSEDAEKQLLVLKNEVALTTKEQFLDWLFSPTASDVNNNEDFPRAAHEIRTLQTEFENEIELQLQLQMMKDYPTDSVSALLMTPWL